MEGGTHEQNSNHTDPRGSTCEKKAQEILSKLNITMSEAISMYLSQIALQRGIPFELKVPNELTTKTLRESEEGKNLHSASSTEQLFKELDA